MGYDHRQWSTNTAPMPEKKTTPYVSDSKIAQYASQYVQPYDREVKRACDHMRDLYEARLSAIIKERDDARAQLKEVEKASESLRIESVHILSRGQNYTPSWEEHERLRARADEMEKVLSTITPDTSHHIDTIRSTEASAINTIKQAVEYGKGCASIVETILNGQGIPPENMQHCVAGFWKYAHKASNSLQSMEAETGEVVAWMDKDGKTITRSARAQYGSDHPISQKYHIPLVLKYDAHPKPQEADLTEPEIEQIVTHAEEAANDMIDSIRTVAWRTAVIAIRKITTKYRLFPNP